MSSRKIPERFQRPAVQIGQSVKRVEDGLVSSVRGRHDQ